MRKHKTSGVYRITHIPSGRCYIGSSACMESRFTEHKRHLRLGDHHSIILQRAWNKHGSDEFQISVIEECPVECLLEREQKWIDEMSPVFNIAKYAGAPMRGRTVTFSEEHRRKLSIASTGSNNACFGIGAWAGKTHTPETRQKMSIAKRGIQLGPWSDERKQELARRTRLRYQSPEMRRKASEAATLRWAKQHQEMRKDDQ